MKNLIFILVLSMILISCGNRPKPVYKTEYSYAQFDIVPDSNKVKMAEWITKTVAATNCQMTGGDYEDPEDVVEQVEETANNLFSVKEDGLFYKTKSNDYWQKLTKDRMTKKELRILDSLKYNER